MEQSQESVSEQLHDSVMLLGCLANGSEQQSEQSLRAGILSSTDIWFIQLETLLILVTEQHRVQMILIQGC